jgi:hypoxanthine phosphoribosyltransferase
MHAPQVLLDAHRIAQIVRRLAGEITADHPDGVVLVAVLKGALIFAADLARAIRHVPVEIEFMAISRFAPDSGRVRILHDVGTDLGGRDVVLVEDIVDTGLTLTYLRSQLAGRAPRSLRTCTLLDRPGRRIVPLAVDYRGFELGDEFVLGYGLHAQDRYRNLPYVVAAERAAVVADVDAYVPALYGRPDRRAGTGVRGPGGRVDGGRTEEP